MQILVCELDAAETSLDDEDVVTEGEEVHAVISIREGGAGDVLFASNVVEL